MSLLCSPLQNEEVLKKCAQDYLARIKQEEQRYQTLKLHAEEKLAKYVDTQNTSASSMQRSVSKGGPTFLNFPPRLYFEGPTRRLLKCVLKPAQRARRWLPVWGRNRWRTSLWNRLCNKRWKQPSAALGCIHPRCRCFCSVAFCNPASFLVSS